MSKRTIAVLMVAVVALGAMAGVAAAEGDLGVEVDDTDGEPTVTVTQNDSTVENATVNVSVVDPANESYAGTGDYTTDENGTVVLPATEEDVTIEVTAEYENGTASTAADLEAPADLAVDVTDTDGEPLVTVTDNDTGVENASVNVTTADGQNVTYVGEGGFTTDENGTVTLDTAEQNVTVDVVATFENETASTTADLTVADDGDEADEEQPFGQLVRDFIDRLQDRDGGIGAAVSDFVTDNNPGNAPDHAGSSGGPDDAGPGNASDAPGNAPDNAGPGNASDGAGNAPDDAGPDNASDGAGNAPEDPGNGGGNADADGEDDGDEDGSDRGQGNGNGNGPP